LAVNGEVPPVHETVNFWYWPASTSVLLAVTVGTESIVLTPIARGIEFLVTGVVALSVIMAFQDVPVRAVITKVFVVGEVVAPTIELNVVEPVMLKKLTVNGEVPPVHETVNFWYWPMFTRVLLAMTVGTLRAGLTVTVSVACVAVWFPAEVSPTNTDAVEVVVGAVMHVADVCPFEHVTTDHR